MGWRIRNGKQIVKFDSHSSPIACYNADDGLRLFA